MVKLEIIDDQVWRDKDYMRSQFAKSMDITWWICLYSLILSIFFGIPRLLYFSTVLLFILSSFPRLSYRKWRKAEKARLEKNKTSDSGSSEPSSSSSTD